MRRRTFRPWSAAVAAMTAAIFTAACIDAPPPDAEAPARADVELWVTAPQLAPQQHVMTHREAAATLLRDVASFDADGRATTDPAALLGARTAVVHGRAGDVTITGGPDGLRVAGGLAGAPAMHVRADVAAGRLDVIARGGVTSVEVVGVDGAARARALGTLALQLLVPGDPSVLHGDGAEYGAVGVVVIVIGIVFASWVACVTLGSYLCGQACANTCANSGGVKSYKMICGYSTEGIPSDCLCTCNGNGGES
jgi:hypothetical protein